MPITYLCVQRACTKTLAERRYLAYFGGALQIHTSYVGLKTQKEILVIGYAVSYILIVLLGLEHQVLLHCCDCEPVTVTIVRARMWPASPQYPRLAFSFEMMDWVEALLLECQVAVKEFCGALYFKCPYVIGKVCYIALL